MLTFGAFGLLLMFLGFTTRTNDPRIPSVAHARYPSGIGVIDGHKLKMEATCFKAHEKLSELMSSIFSRVRDSESEMKTEYDKVKNDSTLPQKQKLKDMAKIESKWTDISSKYNVEIQAIKDTDLKVTEYIQTKLAGVIESISKSLKLSIVLSKGTRDAILVFYNIKELDITDLVVQKMNEVLPEVDLKELSTHD
ncbi:MAG: OmpH family outer membrane protein [Holosporales bacterium]|nr:OmpH family outer membrane protein [Holosporales bacterium]